MPGKAKGKKGGCPVKQPKRPAPPQSSSDEEDEEMTLIRGLIARMEALEKAKAAPSNKGAGPSGGGGVPPPKVPRRTRGSVKSQLLTSLSSRLAALEEGLSPAGPGPATPALPPPASEVPALEQPSPLLPPPAAPAGQLPTDPANPLPPVKQVQRVSTRGCPTPGTHVGLSLGTWRAEAQQAIAASLAPSTRASYAAKLEAFSLFRESEGLVDVWPVPVEHIQQFLVFLHRAGRAVSTLGGYLAALAFEAQVRGVGDSSADPRVRRMLEGWTRAEPRPRDSRRPFTLDLVAPTLDRLVGCCSGPWEVSLFRAAVLVAFFGAFRPSELLPRSGSSPRDRCLQYSDLTFGEGEARLFLRRSKTDQRGRGQTVRLVAAREVSVCPVAALRHYVGLAPFAGSCLFSHSDQTPLTQYQFLAVLRRALRAAGVPLQGLTLHSFRIGAATTATNIGLHESAVQRIGRWRSVAVRRYVR
ncbi:uncharacterized protein LOC128329827 [Hemicordylus capensis]|uniref:uncharacterized protein LOC128329827 n=1 Tax=Hemicordylus capensis TaxID=884348 RepID=UPI002303571A|nr:uncharacterized protein LOC128329827 [Hemicordylus capensis]